MYIENEFITITPQEALDMIQLLTKAVSDSFKYNQGSFSLPSVVGKDNKHYASKHYVTVINKE